VKGVRILSPLNVHLLFAISGEVKSVEKTPQPTAAGTLQTLPAPSSTLTYFASPTPASEHTQTPIATFLAIKWFIIIAIIASSTIIVTFLYLLYLLTGAK